MTFGGSLFPGALGAMLIEILPFLRGIGSDIRDVLGDDNPALIPTVMVTYAMTSFLVGLVFLILGALKAGQLVCRAPKSDCNIGLTFLNYRLRIFHRPF